MSTILNPIDTRILRAAQNLASGLICFSGGVGTGKDVSLNGMLNKLLDDDDDPRLVIAISEIRFERQVWELESVIETGLVLTTMQASSPIDCIMNLFKFNMLPGSFEKISVGSVFSSQELIPTLRGVKSLSYETVMASNISNEGFIDLMRRIERVAKGRDTSQIRFADIIQPSDELNAMIQGALMGAELDDPEMECAFAAFRQGNPALAVQMCPPKFLATEVLVVDENLLMLLMQGRLVEVRNYVESLNIPSKKDIAVEAMLRGLIDPTEVELAFGLLT